MYYILFNIIVYKVMWFLREIVRFRVLFCEEFFLEDDIYKVFEFDFELD